MVSSIDVRRQDVSLPPPSCADCSVKPLALCGVLTSDQPVTLQAVRRDCRKVTARRLVLHTGEAATEVYTVLSGWAFRFKLLRDGRRQILGYYLPGDMIATEALLEPVVHFSVQAVTELSLCVFDSSDFKTSVDGCSTLRHQFHKLCFRKFDAMDGRLTCVGKGNADERLAHFIMSIYGKLIFRRLAEGNSFLLPLRHEHIADTIGLTPVHVSRTFSELRKQGLIDVRDQQISILNQPKMLMLAGLENDYLAKIMLERPAL